ncbi:unnamed protein product [Arctogadus glacialis]
MVEAIGSRRVHSSALRLVTTPRRSTSCGSFTTPLCSPTSHQRPLLQGLAIQIGIQFVAMVILQYYSERYSYFFALCGLYFFVFVVGGDNNIDRKYVNIFQFL